MRLYLVRHAQAKPKDEDAERHLSAAGRKEIRKVAKFLKPLDLRVAALWHSGKTRAAETAEILATAIHAAAGVTAHRGLEPDDDVRPIAERIERTRDDLAIVGHMPLLATLAIQLLDAPNLPEKLAFPTAAVACLERDDDGAWRLEWLITPALIP
jgi:phosphohistidine phosphatase